MGHQTRNLPIDQQRARHQAWVNSLPQADQAQQNQWLINGEHAHLVLQTISLPIDQQRAIHQNWIDSLPQAYRTHHNEGVLDTERYRLGRQTENLPLDQQRARHQAWIDSLPQADQAQQNQILLGDVNQQREPLSQPPVEHRPTEQHAEGSSTSNRGDSSSGSSSERPTRRATLRSAQRANITNRIHEMPINDRREIYRQALNVLNIEPNIEPPINLEPAIADFTQLGASDSMQYPYMSNMFFARNRPQNDVLARIQRQDQLPAEINPQQLNEHLNHIQNALDMLHNQRPLMHLDIRPTNILLRDIRPTNILLRDFGIIGPQATQRMNDVLARRQRQNQLAEIIQRIQPIPQPDQIPHEQLNEPLHHIDEGSIQQDLLRLLNEFRELQGLPQLEERFHPIVKAIAESSRISRDRITEHQATVSSLVQRERELNLTPEEREQASVSFSGSLMRDLGLNEHLHLAWSLGIRLTTVTPTREVYNRAQDSNLNRAAERQMTNAGLLLGRDLSQVPTEQYTIACSTVMAAMEERIDNVYNDSEDSSVMSRVRLMMEDVFMRGGRSERRDSAARQDPLLRQLQDEYLPRMFDNALRQAPYARQIQDFESRQNSLSPDQQDRLREMRNQQKEIEDEMHDIYQEIETLLRNFKDKEEQR